MTPRVSSLRPSSENHLLEAAAAVESAGGVVHGACSRGWGEAGRPALTATVAASEHVVVTWEWAEVGSGRLLGCRGSWLKREAASPAARASPLDRARTRVIEPPEDDG